MDADQADCGLVRVAEMHRQITDCTAFSFGDHDVVCPSTAALVNPETVKLVASRSIEVAVIVKARVAMRAGSNLTQCSHVRRQHGTRIRRWSRDRQHRVQRERDSIVDVYEGGILEHAPALVVLFVSQEIETIDPLCAAPVEYGVADGGVHVGRHGTGDGHTKKRRVPLESLAEVRGRAHARSVAVAARTM
jgi:hypothetical protein